MLLLRTRSLWHPKAAARMTSRMQGAVMLEGITISMVQAGHWDHSQAVDHQYEEYEDIVGLEVGEIPNHTVIETLHADSRLEVVDVEEDDPGSQGVPHHLEDLQRRWHVGQGGQAVEYMVH